MLYTKEEVLEFIKGNDVKFIRLAFCDIYGVQKNISVMANEAERAFDEGISFDASAIAGFGDESKSDLLLFPDPSTLAVLPWRPTHGRVIRFFCSIKYPDGKPFELDSRRILLQAANALKKEGYGCNFGAECEFYLFKTDELGNPTEIPFDNAGYMDIAPSDRGENVRREVCISLEEMGILPESSHHEEGPGQNEITFKYSDPISSADNMITFKSAVCTIAHQNGLHATFDPKPLDGKPGNGFHINMSPFKISTGKPCFEPFIAGIMQHICAMTIFTNSLDSSYKRLGELKAPKYVSYSPENRSQLIRVPAAKGASARIELRSPDPMCNPYLAYALLIYAGLDGIKRKLVPPQPININLYTADLETSEKPETLPNDRKTASRLAFSDEFVKSVLHPRVIDAYSI